MEIADTDFDFRRWQRPLQLTDRMWKQRRDLYLHCSSQTGCGTHPSSGTVCIALDWRQCEHALTASNNSCASRGTYVARLNCFCSRIQYSTVQYNTIQYNTIETGEEKRREEKRREEKRREEKRREENKRKKRKTEENTTEEKRGEEKNREEEEEQIRERRTEKTRQEKEEKNR